MEEVIKNPFDFDVVVVASLIGFKSDFTGTQFSGCSLIFLLLDLTMGF